MTQRARTTAKRERCDSSRAKKKRRKRERRKPTHGSAFCLVNLFLFSPPEKPALIYEGFACRRISDSPAASRGEKFGAALFTGAIPRTRST